MGESILLDSSGSFLNIIFTQSQSRPMFMDDPKVFLSKRFLQETYFVFYEIVKSPLHPSNDGKYFEVMGKQINYLTVENIN